jgi:hypothetical protein
MLVDAFEQTKADTVHSALLHAALQVGAFLLHSGLVVPAIAIGHVLKEIPATSEPANALVYQATSEPNTPLFLRDWIFDYDCPDNFSGKETYQEAGVLVQLMRWKQALALLESLTQYADSWSKIWRNIAVIHFWLLDIEKGCEALKMYAFHPNTSFEDAVDAETIRLLFLPDPFGDQTQRLSIDYTITDADKALETLLSVPLLYYLPTQNWKMTPPPRGAFIMLDRPLPDSETELTAENVPMRQAMTFLFGKETDKEARLAVMVESDSELAMIESKIRDVLGDLVQFPGNVVERVPVSQTQVLAACPLFVPPDRQASAEMIRNLVFHYNTDQFPEMWMSLPLGFLDGKTPSEAAKESKYTIPLLAAIQMIEEKKGEENSEAVAQTLRSRLGLPMPETIVVTESPGEDALSQLDAYPVWRWYRFDVSQLSTEVLAGGLQIVASMHEPRSATRFAEELLSRPMDSMPFSVRVTAFEALITVSQEKDDFEKALLWIERAKSESAAQNIPDAAWCLHEITLHLVQNNAEGANSVIQYLLTHYKNDASVMGALQKLFVQLGLYNPDGTPSAAFMQAKMESDAQRGEQAIWTPDGGTSSGAAGASKLWVPD